MLCEKLIKKEENLALVGLGYVGMPIAVAFSKKAKVVGFDLNQAKIDMYKMGIDPTCEVGDETIAECTVEFTSDETKLREAKFHIVAVPTPVNSDHTPDLAPVIGASEIVGRNLVKGSVAIANKLKIPTIIVGLTIVALGTSTPEFVVSIKAALNNSAGISLGNVIGSNTANILLILGITALISPIKCRRRIFLRDYKFLLAVSILFDIFAFIYPNGLCIRIIWTCIANDLLYNSIMFSTSFLAWNSNFSY